METVNKLEALLFWKGEPIAISELAKILEISAEDVNTAVDELKKRYTDRGISVLMQNEQVALVTSAEASQLIEKLIREELNTDLGKASLETLATIVYKGPISRPEIDYIRGVNSSFVVRHLMIRGLIEKAPEANNKVFLYQPTLELTKYLGLSSIADLPEYQSLRQGLAASLEVPTKDNE